MYFSYDEENGFMIHDTKEEAKDEAMAALEYERENAKGDEWNTDVEAICWGKIVEHVVPTESGPEYWDFGLVAPDTEE